MKPFWQGFFCGLGKIGAVICWPFLRPKRTFRELMEDVEDMWLKP